MSDPNSAKPSKEEPNGPGYYFDGKKETVIGDTSAIHCKYCEDVIEGKYSTRHGKRYHTHCVAKAEVMEIGKAEAEVIIKAVEDFYAPPTLKAKPIIPVDTDAAYADRVRLAYYDAAEAHRDSQPFIEVPPGSLWRYTVNLFNGSIFRAQEVKDGFVLGEALIHTDNTWRAVEIPWHLFKTSYRRHYGEPSYEKVPFGPTSAPLHTEPEGRKDDDGKARWDLLPFGSLAQVVDVLTYGAKKYSPGNWQKVPNPRARYVSAALRHLAAYANGEKIDKESGKSHLAHAVCCLLFLMWFDDGAK